MMSLRKVCEITGLSRAAIQRAEKAGLVSPTDKTDGGYNLYDENAVRRLLLVQTFREAGYDTPQIRAILHKDDLDLRTEYARLIRALEEKRRRITGMIRAVETVRAMLELPSAAVEALTHSDLEQVYRTKSFAGWLDGLPELAGDMSNGETAEYMSYSAMFLSLMGVAALKEREPGSRAVLLAVDAAVHTFIMTACEFDEETAEEVGKMPVEEQRREAADVILEDVLAAGEDFAETVRELYGEDAVDFIRSAVTAYKERLTNKQNKEEKQ